MKLKSEFVNDDWERIYIDNELVFENHRVTARQLMEIIVEYTSIISYEFTEIQEDEL